MVLSTGKECLLETGINRLAVLYYPASRAAVRLLDQASFGRVETVQVKRTLVSPLQDCAVNVLEIQAGKVSTWKRCAKN